MVDVIKGKLRGVRTVSGDEASASYSDEWTRVVKIEGCDYRVSGEMLLEWLGLYGEVLSELVEDVFEDSEDSEGENTTGIYSVKMRLNCNIPQLLPIGGRRIKIYYRNINKLCTSCFWHHSRRDCKEEKVKWIDYVSNFVNSNPHIDPALYGKWLMILERERKQKLINEAHFNSKQPEEKSAQRGERVAHYNDGRHVNQNDPVKESQDDQVNKQMEENTNQSEESQGTVPKVTPITSRPEKPKPEDFNLPANPEDWRDLVDKLVALGLTSKEANVSLEKRKKQYNNALKEYTSGGLPTTKKGRPKSRKTSLNDV